MTHGYRSASPLDAHACVELRGKTRENAVSAQRLAALGITAESWGRDIASGRLPGHVCTVEGAIVGYGFGDRETGEVVVLALLPGVEGRGIGKELLRRVVEDLREAGHERLFLGCSSDPATRSHGFYRHLGWVSTGQFDANQDEILELRPTAFAGVVQTTDTPSDEALLAVETGLELHNHAVAPLTDVAPLAAFVHDPSGRVVGGAVGRTWGACCELLQLWVDPGYRGQGLGSRLLQAFEARAGTRDCTVFYLTTLSFQAPDFYRRHGYEVLARIAGYPNGITKFLMHKVQGPPGA